MLEWLAGESRRNAGQAPTEEIQLGSLGKVMSKLKDVKAAAAAAEVINFGAKLAFNRARAAPAYK